MSINSLESLFREAKNRQTDRAAFGKAVARISALRSRKAETAVKPDRAMRKAS